MNLTTCNIVLSVRYQQVNSEGSFLQAIRHLAHVIAYFGFAVLTGHLFGRSLVRSQRYCLSHNILVPVLYFGIKQRRCCANFTSTVSREIYSNYVILSVDK